MTVEVDVDEVRRLKARLREINAIPFEDIVWVQNGKPVELDKKAHSEWAFMGFNNADFVRFAIDKEPS